MVPCQVYHDDELLDDDQSGEQPSFPASAQALHYFSSSKVQFLCISKNCNVIAKSEKKIYFYYNLDNFGSKTQLVASLLFLMV